MANNNEYYPLHPKRKNDPDDNFINQDESDTERDILDEAVEHFLYTPRKAKGQRANAFLQDWMRRFGRI